MSPKKITLRNYYFDQLIHGTILSEEEAAYAQNYLSISDNANSFAILYCNVYLDTLELNNDPQGMINILSPDYADVISDILSSYFIHSYIMQGSKNSVYTILLYNREELDKVEDLFLHVHTTLLQDYNIWIYGGLGLYNRHHLLCLEIVSPIQRGCKTCLQPGLPVSVS